MAGVQSDGGRGPSEAGGGHTQITEDFVGLYSESNEN